MTSRAKKISHGDYYASLEVIEGGAEEDELEANLAEELEGDFDEEGEPVWPLHRPGSRVSGYRIKRVCPPRSRKPVPRRYGVLIRYHYPLVIFPPALKSELKELEEFFGIGAHQRGEGSSVHQGRMTATLSYRLSNKVDAVRGLAKAVVELLDRYGAETMGHEIRRI